MPQPSAVPAAVPAAVAPSSVAADGTIAVQISDNNGYNYLPYAELVMGASATDPNACRIRYDRGSGAGNEVLSVYAGDFTAPGLIGTAPVGSPGDSVDSFRNCVLDIGNSYVVSEAGVGDVLHVKVNFRTSGTFNTYLTAFDRAGASGTGQSAIYVPPNDFSLSPLVGAVTVTQGTPSAFTLSVPASGSFSGPVTLSATAPTGVTVAFQSNPVNTPTPGAVTVTLTASSAAALGNGTVAITGTGASGTHVLNVAISVAAAPVSDFSLTAASGQTVRQGSSTTFQLGAAAIGSFVGSVSLAASGTTGLTVTLQNGSVNLATAGTGTVLVTVAVAASAPTGAATVTITGTSGSLTHSVSVTVQVTGAPVSDFSLTAVTGIAVAQGSSTTFTLSAAAIGSFSGTVSVSASAPTADGISAAVQSSSLSVPGSTVVTISASAAAALGTWTVSITGTGSSGTHGLAITVYVGAAPATPSFTIPFGGTLSVAAGNAIGVFPIAVTGLNGFASTVTVAVDAVATTTYVSATVNGLQSTPVSPGAPVSVAVQFLGVWPPGTQTVNGVPASTKFCAGVTATSGSVTVGPYNFCIFVVTDTTVPSSISFSVAPAVTIPAGVSTTVYGSVATYNYNTAVNFTDSVSCSSGASGCQPGVSVAAVPSTGGLARMAMSTGTAAVGTVATHTIAANGVAARLPATVGGGTGSVLLSRRNCSPCGGSSGLTLSTDNDGSTAIGSYYLICTGVSCSTANLGNCSVAGATGTVITTTPTAGSTTDFTISATASTVAFAGSYGLSCPYTGYGLLSAGSLAVYDATPVITSVSPATVTGGAANYITVTGHNFGNNPILSVGCPTPAQGCTGPLTQPFSNWGINPSVSLSGTFRIPAYPAGTVLPVTVTSTGEAGNSFQQNPQNPGASQTVSSPYYLQISSAGPSISSVSQSPNQTLYPGAVATANGVTLQIYGANFGSGQGVVRICNPNLVPGLPCSASGISAATSVAAGNPNGMWSNTQVNALLTAPATVSPGVYDVWLTASTDANGNPVSGAQATAVYAGGVTVAAINIQLSQVGPTVISTDGNYTEDTTVSVTAVSASNGATVTNFTGPVNIVETTVPQIYSQNNYVFLAGLVLYATGAGIPASVSITTGGTAAFLARSLAGPLVEGAGGLPPTNAVISSTHSPPVPADFPLYQGATLSIPQWISGGLFVPNRSAQTNTPLFDWFQAQAAAIFATNPGLAGDVANVLNSVSTYTTDGSITSGGFTPLIYTAQTQIQINPYLTVLRMNWGDPADLACGNVRTAAFNAIFLHEARHAYQNTVVSNSGQNTENDVDRDHLSRGAASIPPASIFQDSTVVRLVCNDTTSPYSIQNRGYQGDDSFDYLNAPVSPFLFPSLGYARFALEMDGYTFAGSHQ